MCIFTCRNMTTALRAEKLLRENWIRGEIVNIEPTLTKKGCAFGVAVNNASCGQAEKLLTKKRVPFGEVIR